VGRGKGWRPEPGISYPGIHLDDSSVVSQKGYPFREAGFLRFRHTGQGFAGRVDLAFFLPGPPIDLSARAARDQSVEVACACCSPSRRGFPVRACQFAGREIPNPPRTLVGDWWRSFARPCISRHSAMMRDRAASGRGFDSLRARHMWFTGGAVAPAVLIRKSSRLRTNGACDKPLASGGRRAWTAGRRSLRGRGGTMSQQTYRSADSAFRRRGRHQSRRQLKTVRRHESSSAALSTTATAAGTHRQRPVRRT
jgi:hypothetical protein